MEAGLIELGEQVFSADERGREKRGSKLGQQYLALMPRFLMRSILSAWREKCGRRRAGEAPGHVFQAEKRHPGGVAQIVFGHVTSFEMIGIPVGTASRAFFLVHIKVTSSSRKGEGRLSHQPALPGFVFIQAKALVELTVGGKFIETTIRGPDKCVKR